MGVTPLTLAVTVNAPTELPARTTVTTLPRLSDVWVVGFTVAAATGATAHDTWAPRSGKPSALSTVGGAAACARSSARCRRIVIQAAVPYSPPQTASASRPTPPARPAMRVRVTSRTDDGRDSAPRLRAPRRYAVTDCTSPRAHCARHSPS